MTALLDAGRSLLKEYHKRGYEAYFVGGCVRNLLLGLPVADIDICTNAKPEETLSMFERAIPTGIRFGTVTVLWEGYSFEVTTYRTEGTYRDSRRPEHVRFVRNLVEDLKRRDFTINAMAMDADGNLIDPFGGQQDLKNRLVRAVGDPRERFQEDGLRLLRAVRFAGVLDFAIEPATWNALLEQKARLRAISLERIVQEMDKLLQSEHLQKGLRLLLEAEMLFTFRAPEKIRIFQAGQELDLLWALLLHFAEPVNQIPFRLDRLPFSKKRKALIRLCHEWYRQNPRRTQEEILQLAFEHPIETVLAYAQFQQLLNDPDGEPPIRERLQAAWQQLPCPDSREIAVRGDEIQAALGIPPGPWIREAIRDLWIQVNFHRLPNEKNALLQYLAEHKEKWVP